jgi:hypothetical protein
LHGMRGSPVITGIIDGDFKMGITRRTLGDAGSDANSGIDTINGTTVAGATRARGRPALV